MPPKVAGTARAPAARACRLASRSTPVPTACTTSSLRTDAVHETPGAHPLVAAIVRALPISPRLSGPGQSDEIRQYPDNRRGTQGGHEQSARQPRLLTSGLRKCLRPDFCGFLLSTNRSSSLLPAL